MHHPPSPDPQGPPPPRPTFPKCTHQWGADTGSTTKHLHQCARFNSKYPSYTKDHDGDHVCIHCGTRTNTQSEHTNRCWLCGNTQPADALAYLGNGEWICADADTCSGVSAPTVQQPPGGAPPERKTQTPDTPRPVSISLSATEMSQRVNSQVEVEGCDCGHEGLDTAFHLWPCPLSRKATRERDPIAETVAELQAAQTEHVGPREDESDADEVFSSPPPGVNDDAPVRENELAALRARVGDQGVALNAHADWLVRLESALETQSVNLSTRLDGMGRRVGQLWNEVDGAAHRVTGVERMASAFREFMEATTAHLSAHNEHLRELQADIAVLTPDPDEVDVTREVDSLVRAVRVAVQAWDAYVGSDPTNARDTARTLVDMARALSALEAAADTVDVARADDEGGTE